MVNPYAQYHKTSIETANPGKLVLMLYDGAIRFLRQGITAIEKGRVEEAHQRVVRVQQIIHELNVSLNRNEGGELAENLFSLYEYMQHRLLQGNVHKDPVILNEVISLLETLRLAWKEVFERSQVPDAPSDKSE